MARLILAPAQCRGARAVADLSIAKLERSAGVPASTIRNFEREAAAPSVADLDAILGALTRQGICCSIDADGVEIISIDWRRCGDASIRG